MRNEIHSKDPKTVLGRNLSAAFKKRGLSARSVARSLAASGMRMSNKTVSNVLNGEGNPQLDNLLALAKQAKVPLWQLLSPAVDLSQFAKEDFAGLVDGIAGLSEFGLQQVRRIIQGEQAIKKLSEASTASPER